MTITGVRDINGYGWVIFGLVCHRRKTCRQQDCRQLQQERVLKGLETVGKKRRIVSLLLFFFINWAGAVSGDAVDFCMVEGKYRKIDSESTLPIYVLALPLQQA